MSVRKSVICILFLFMLVYLNRMTLRKKLTVLLFVSDHYKVRYLARIDYGVDSRKQS